MPALTAALFIAVTLVYGLGTLSASMPRWLALYAWAVIACVVCVVNWVRNRGRVDQVDLLALTLLAWMILSIAWSQDWRQGVFEATNAAALCAVFMWVRTYHKWIPEAALVALTGVLVLQWLAPYDWGGQGNMNFQTEAILLLLALGTGTRWIAAWLLLFAVSMGYLIIGNPSKIELAVLLAIGIFYGAKLFRGENADLSRT